MEAATSPATSTAQLHFISKPSHHSFSVEITLSACPAGTVTSMVPLVVYRSLSAIKSFFLILSGSVHSLALLLLHV